MLMRTFGLCVTAFCCLSHAPVWAGPASPESAIKEVMTLSGMQHTLRQIPQQVVAGFDQQSQKIPAAQQAALRRALGESFDAPMMERHVAKELRETLRPEVTAKTLEWLRTDLGKKITTLEEAAGNPTRVAELQVFAKQLEKTPPPQDRLQLIRRIDMATNASELLLDVTESMMVSIASAYDATLPAQQRTGTDRIRVQVSRERDAWRPQAQTHVLISMLYTYRSLSQTELDQYVAFLETESGLEFYVQSGAALKGAMDLGIHRATRAMMEILKPGTPRKTT